MTAALLDHPWPLEATVDARSDGFRVFESFVDLVRSRGLSIVPFIEPRAFEQVWERIDYRRAARTSGYAKLRLWGEHFVRRNGGDCAATTDPLPPGLSHGWKCGMRDAMVNIEDWRTPQLIVSDRRRAQWAPGNEVDVWLDPCNGDSGSGPFTRVIAVLENYQAHRFALSDLDPWDLRRLDEPTPATDRQHPCFLPRPPIFERLSLEEIRERLPEARRLGWIVGGRYYFIPCEDWRFERISKGSWRAGRSFVCAKAPKSNRTGPLDYMERVWSWHHEERHWDVQIDGGRNRLRVSHTGKPL